MLTGDYSMLCRKQIGPCACSHCNATRKAVVRPRSGAHWYARFLEHYYDLLKANPGHHRSVAGESEQFVRQLAELVNDETDTFEDVLPQIASDSARTPYDARNQVRVSH